MIAIDLDVLWLTDELKPIQEAGIDVPLEECAIKTHTFCIIAAVRPHDNPNYCEILCDGEVFIINEPFLSVRNKIKDQLVLKWN